ncbi:MAG: SMP-30/gluconolactonase/LRE family protein [Nocardioides sp.]
MTQTGHELTVLPVPGPGAEDVVVDHEGRVLTGTADGAVYRLAPDGSRIDRVGQTGGRPLGLELLPDGRVLVCDAQRGLLALDPESGHVEELTTLVNGQRMAFCNNAAVHSGGDIFFSDSSRLYGIDRWKADLVENTASGRLLRRGPDGGVEVLADGLRFANGVALAADESYVAVAETAGRTVVRLWLSGPRAGERELLVHDLPGYPDNIARGSDGLIWVTIASPTDPVLERLMTGPVPLRRLAWRLPARLQPKPKRTVRVMAFDDRGATVHDLSVPGTTYHMVTGVREHEGRVWLGSLEEPAVAVLDRGTDR